MLLEEVNRSLSSLLLLFSLFLVIQVTSDSPSMYYFRVHLNFGILLAWEDSILDLVDLVDGEELMTGSFSCSASMRGE